MIARATFQAITTKAMAPKTEPTAINTVPSGIVLCLKNGLNSFEGTVTVGTGTPVVERVGILLLERVGLDPAEPSLLVLTAVITIAEYETLVTDAAFVVAELAAALVVAVD